MASAAVEKKILDALKSGNNQQALDMAIKHIGKHFNSKTPMTSLKGMAEYLEILCENEQLSSAQSVVEKIFDVFSATSAQQKADIIAHLSLEIPLNELMMKRSFETAVRMVSDLQIFHNRSIFLSFFKKLIDEAQYKLAFTVGEHVEDLTKEAIIKEIVLKRHFLQALKYIKEYKLYDVNREYNFFKVDLYIDELIKRRSIKEALIYIKAFNLCDNTDFNNPKFPKYSDANLVLFMFEAREWLLAKQFISESKFCDTLKKTFTPFFIWEQMIRKTDWKALSTYIKTENLIVKGDGDSETVDQARKSLRFLLALLVKKKEFAKALKFLLKYDDDQLNAKSAFPIKLLLSKMIESGDLACIKKYVVKYDLKSEFSDLSEEFLLKRYEMLQIFRETLEMKKNQPSSLSRMRKEKELQYLSLNKGGGEKVVISELEYQCEKISIDEREVKIPRFDDELLVDTGPEFIALVQESNANLLLDKNYSHEEMGESDGNVSPQYVQTANLNERGVTERIEVIGPRLKSFIRKKRFLETQQQKNLNSSLPREEVYRKEAMSHLQPGSVYEQIKQVVSDPVKVQQDYEFNHRRYNGTQRDVNDFQDQNQGRGLTPSAGWNRQSPNPMLYNPKSTNIIGGQQEYDPQEKSNRQFYKEGNTVNPQRSSSRQFNNGEPRDYRNISQLNPNASRFSPTNSISSFASATNQNPRNSGNQMQASTSQPPFRQHLEMNQLNEALQKRLQLQEQESAYNRLDNYDRKPQPVETQERQLRVERIERLVQGLLRLNEEAQFVRRELAVLEQEHRVAIRTNDLRKQHMIHDDYQKLQHIQQQHKEKEKQILFSARNDADVAEAVREFQRRKEAMALRNENRLSAASPNEHQLRQFHRLRQHELEKSELLRQREQQLLFREQELLELKKQEVMRDQQARERLLRLQARSNVAGFDPGAKYHQVDRLNGPDAMEPISLAARQARELRERNSLEKNRDLNYLSSDYEHQNQYYAQQDNFSNVNITSSSARGEPRFAPSVNIPQTQDITQPKLSLASTINDNFHDELNFMNSFGTSDNEAGSLYHAQKSNMDKKPAKYNINAASFEPSYMSPVEDSYTNGQKSEAFSLSPDSNLPEEFSFVHSRATLNDSLQNSDKNKNGNDMFGDEDAEDYTLDQSEALYKRMTNTNAEIDHK